MGKGLLNGGEPSDCARIVGRVYTGVLGKSQQLGLVVIVEVMMGSMMEVKEDGDRGGGESVIRFHWWGSWILV